MSRLHEFERLIDEKLRSLFRSPAQEPERREVIEVHRAILDEVASRIETMPRGRRIFAYPHLTVRVLPPDPERRRAYEVVFTEADALQRDIRARLEEGEAEIPERFRVDVELVEELPEGIGERGFDIAYDRAPGAPELPRTRLLVLHGQAEKPDYVFNKRRINMGRLGDVLDPKQRLVRRNDIAFKDSADTPNSTVSRTHAHIEFDAKSGEFRIFDDHSALGTTVLREGEFVNVPRGTSKGAALRSGDEIVLGQARLAFEILRPA
jgi:hypothetical protein